MYAEEAGLLFPYFQSCSQEIQYLDELWPFGNANVTGKVTQTSTVSEYDLGGEGDLFKAPEPINTIIEEPVLDIHLFYGGEDAVCSQTEVTYIVSMQGDPLLSDVFYECKKDLLEKTAIDESFPEASEIKVPIVVMEEGLTEEKYIPAISDGAIQKSVSSRYLTSTKNKDEWYVQPNYLEFQELVTASGMRRAFSEGDIQSPRTSSIQNCTHEERQEKLSRYRKKKNRRNFDRKIKYACRKALADSQPRVRGRFARIKEAAVSNFT